jgi:hypothetical protein
MPMARGGVWRGLLVGLLPLVWFVGIVAMTLALTILARMLVAGAGFFAQQQASVIVLAGGLLVAAVIYIVACVRALRRVAAWQQSVESGARAAGALWGLGLTAVVVLLPVLVTLVLPQHPAPTLAP